MNPLQVDPSSSLPAYKQIADQIKSDIVSGNLNAGDQLPPVRKLADQVGISRLTIHRAYLLLIDQNVLIARQGSGTFVAPTQKRDVSVGILRQFTDRGPIIQFEETAKRSHIRSFATHIPDPFLTDLRDYFADQLALAQENVWNLYVPEPMGENKLRQAAARWFQAYLPLVDHNQILVNPGFNSLKTFFELTTKPGDTILTQDPSHLLASDYYAKLHRFPYAIDPINTSPNQLEEIIELKKIKAAVINPYFGTGTGECWSKELMSKFLRIIDEKKIPLFYALTRALSAYGNLNPYPLPKNLEKVWFEIQWKSLTVSSFNLTTTLVAKEHQKSVFARDVSRESIPKIQQLAMANYLNRGMREHLRKSSAEYALRATTLRKILQTHLHSDITFSIPEGGFGLIVRMPKPYDAKDFFQRCLDEAVAAMPGEYICHNPENHNIIRLSFGLLDIHEIKRAAPQICKVFNATLDR